MEKPSAAAGDRARVAEPGAGWRRGRRSWSLRVGHPGGLRERGAGLGRPGGVRTCECGRGISSRAESAGGGEVAGRGPKAGRGKVKARRPLPQSAHQVFINKPGTLTSCLYQPEIQARA